MNFDLAPLLKVLLSPESVCGLSLETWDVVIRQGRSANLLAKLAYEIDRYGLMSEVQEAPRMHLESAICVVERQKSAIQWEVHCLHCELDHYHGRVILLKGAAYVLAGLPNAKGRVFSDIDILVPKSDISFVESELMKAGWQTGHHNAYDQRYYRLWMHEIPPMRHISRGTTVDVHHTLLPVRGRTEMVVAHLFDDALPLKNSPYWVLSPSDMFLHSATHLFHEGEFENGLRDLFDLKDLLTHFSSDAHFPDQVISRSKALGLTRPLFYALRYLELILRYPMPESVRQGMKEIRPSSMVVSWMDFCLLRALMPTHKTTTTWSTKLARTFLYFRGHWLRMPLHLLTLHLGRKVWLRMFPENTIAN